MSAAPWRHAPIFTSLRWRLTTAISGVVLLCAVACITGAVIFLYQALTDRATADMRHSLQGVAGFLDDQRRDLLGLAELVAADPSVQTSVLRGDPRTLTVQLTHYYADLNNADVLDVIDTHGRVLVRMEDTVTYNDVVLNNPSVRAALSDREVTAFEIDPREQQVAGGYALRATVPVHLNERVIGAVVVGRQLRSELAARIGHALNVSVNLIAGDQRTGTTVTDGNGLSALGGPISRALLQRIATGSTSIATVTGDCGCATLSGIYPLIGSGGKPVGAVELQAELGPLYDVITKLSFLLLALGAVVVAIGISLAMGIGRRLTARLLALDATAAGVAAVVNAEGPLTDLHGAVSIAGEDEVASLARSFRAMMHALDERLAANARLYESAQERVRELTGLAEIARLLTASDSLQDTLNRLSERVCELVGCTAVAILLPAEGGEPPTYGGCGLPPGFDTMIDQVLRGGNESQGLATVKAMTTGTISWHPTREIAEHHPAIWESAHQMGWGGATAVPLRLQERTIGVMTCFTSGPEPLTASDLSLLTTIADQVAVAVENARLHARARDLAALDERARLARELHDSVTQALFSMTLHARAAQMALERAGIERQGKLGRSIAQLHELTQGALAEMRALIFELRPGALGEEGLAAALQKQAAALSAREGLEVSVQAPRDRLHLDSVVEEHLYRLAQEALHNVVKHANAHHVVVEVGEDAARPGTLVMVIRDDGIGFDTAALNPGHLGLGTMAERARHVGGTFAILSHSGEGTTVRVEVPGALRGDVASVEASLTVTA